MRARFCLMLYAIKEKMHQAFITQGIKLNGIYAPIVITKDGYVIDGWHRIEAAKEMGISVPAIVIDAPMVMISCDDLGALKDAIDTDTNKYVYSKARRGV